MAANTYQIIGRQPTQTDGLREMMDDVVFTGADVIATFNNTLQVTLEGITWAVRREVFPMFVMGMANAIGFARGKRVITGQMVFSMTDRDELLYSFYPSTYGNFDQDGYTGEEWNPWDLQVSSGDSSQANSVWLPELNRQAGDQTTSTLTNIIPVSAIGEGIGRIYRSRAPHFGDELPPFDITLTMVNPQGAAAQLRILGVVLSSETHGYSVNTQIPEKTYTFFARDIVPLHPIKGPGE